jgi:hypothetical protein
VEATKGTVVWPAVDPKAGRWLWGAKSDLVWLAGIGSIIFALVAVPLTLAVPISATWLVAMFLRLGAVCNYPHYAITYQLIYRERVRVRSSWNWFLWSTPVFLAFTVYAAFLNPGIIGFVNRVYLTWSAYHYAAQHFGIASMYQARDKRPLAPDEKLAVQVGFIAVAGYILLLLNMQDGLGASTAFGAKISAGFAVLMLPANAYPLAAVSAVVGFVAYGLGEHWHKERTGQGFSQATRLLFATNVVWFVLPYVHLPGARGPWIGQSISTWLPYAQPFFHCAQYLAICGWRARTTGPIKPIYYFMILMLLGLFLFEGGARGVRTVAKLEEGQAILLVQAVLNIHHFFLDGLMWKSKRKPTPVGASSATPTAKTDEKAAAA